MATACRSSSGQPRVSRRAFLALGSAAAGALWLRRAWGDETAPLTAFQREHLPTLRIPATTRNGAKVPIVVEMSHPMTPEHYVTSVTVVNPRDPIPSKGRFYFTPGNGRVYLAFQARMDPGVSVVTATAECNRHGRFTGTARIEIPDHAGG